MQNFKSKYIFRGLLFTFLLTSLFVYIGNNIPFHNNFVEFLYYSCVGMGSIALVFYVLWEIDVRSQAEYKELLNGRFLPVKFPKSVSLLIVSIILIHKLILGGIDMKNIYNQNVTYNKQYTQLTQSLSGLYDVTWKTFSQKQKIADSTFKKGTELVKIVFENRKDGQNIAWKWVTENQPVPYGEFMSFYKELSSYIESKRMEFYSIELQRQAIVARQNILLDTFPNNLYNKLLKLKHIEYEYSVLSDSTNQVFNTKKENL